RTQAELDEVARQRAAAADALIDAAVAGDGAALHSLLRTWAPEVARVVRVILGPSDMGLDDAVQDALFAFVRALPSFRRESSLYRFASRIAARTALAARRKSRGRHAREALAAEATQFAPRADGAELAQRRKALVHRMFDRLPEPQADVLLLRFLLGYSL